MSLGTRLCHFLKSDVKNFPDGPVVATSPSNAGGCGGSIPGRELIVHVPHSQEKKQKQHPKHKAEATNSIKALKMAHIKKIKSDMNLKFSTISMGKISRWVEGPIPYPSSHWLASFAKCSWGTSTPSNLWPKPGSKLFPWVPCYSCEPGPGWHTAS